MHHEQAILHEIIMVHGVRCWPSRHRIPLRAWRSRRHWEVERTIGSAELGSLHIWTLANRRKSFLSVLRGRRKKRSDKSLSGPSYCQMYIQWEKNHHFQEFHKRWILGATTWVRGGVGMGLNDASRFGDESGELPALSSMLSIFFIWDASPSTLLTLTPCVEKKQAQC